MNSDNAETIRRRVAQKVRHLSAHEARSALDRIRAEGLTIHHEDIRKLTGGYCGQAINAMVIRKLAEQAGIIRKH